MTPLDRYQLLAGLGRLVSSSLDLRKVFWRAAEQLHRTLGCAHVTLLLADGVLEAHKGFAVEFDPAVRWINLPIRSATDAMRPARIESPLTDQGLRQAGYRSRACLPLVCRDKIIGQLTLATRQSEPAWDMPFLEEIAVILATALDNASAYAEIARLKRQVEQANVYLRDEIQHEHFPEMVGGLAAVRQAIDQVAATDSSVLIQGETGTGKELVARAIHDGGRRRSRLLVKVNCGALSPTLITSELFGHEAGAFTGAARRRHGRFELAHRGTLFLDEIGELTLEAQVLLLRVLQDQTLERVGGSQPIPVNVRIIAATHRDLATAVQAGTFRADLFYRLNVFPIRLPPLRERRGDIEALVRHFLQRFGTRMNKRVDSVSAHTLRLLQDYSWPGNVRELQNILERAVIMASGPIIAIDPAWLPATTDPHASSLADSERQAILTALRQADGKIYGPGGAAAALGLKPSTLYGKLRKHGIGKVSGGRFE